MVGKMGSWLRMAKLCARSVSQRSTQLDELVHPYI